MKILVISDSPYLYTGLARVNKNIVRGLSKSGHEVVIGAWGWDQLAYPLNNENKWIYKDNITKQEYVVFPLAKESKKLLTQTYDILSAISFDILITIGDYWNFSGFEMLKSKLNYSYKWISYYTIESRPINEKYCNAFNYMDEIIVPSQFGKEVIKKSFGLDSHFIPYGFGNFYKIDEESIKKLRKKKNLEGKIRFINVSKNQSRKNIPAFMEALSIAHGIDNRIVGYLHTNIEKEVSSQVNIKNMIKRFNLEDVLKIPSKKISLDIGYDDSELNIEYNCSDFLVLSSVAEGFGLPILEAQSCGLPVIATKYSSIPELCVYKELLVDYEKYYSYMEQEIAIIKVDDLVDKMLKASRTSYDSDKLIKFSKGFYWSLMNKRLEKVISSMNKEMSIPAEEI